LQAILVPELRDKVTTENINKSTGAANDRRHKRETDFALEARCETRFAPAQGFVEYLMNSISCVVFVGEAVIVEVKHQQSKC